MNFTHFQSFATTLSLTQQQEWSQRRQTAERIIDQQADAVPDGETVLHLQHYINGEITLAQAIGRILDSQARRAMATS